jgi:hypothetical protein
MAGSEIAALASVVGSAALGAAAGIKLIPELISTRRLVKKLAEEESVATGSEIVAGVRRAGQPKGKLRSSNIAGMVAGALRLRNGGYMRGYSVTPAPTMLGHGHEIDRRYEAIARMLGAEKPEGTLISFRYSSDGDPGAPIDAHLRERPDIEQVHPGARILHDTGLEFMRGQAIGGAFRREKVSLWVSVPSQGGDNSGAGLTAFLNTLLNEVKRDGIMNIARAVAHAKAASATDRITRRLLHEEKAAFREAEKVFKQVERECPLKLERLTPEQTFSTLYLSHHQNANSAPPLSPAVMLNMQQYLCGETIEYGGTFMRHGRYPVAMVAVDTVPQQGPQNQKKIVPSVTRHLIGNPRLNFRHQVVTQFVCLDKRKSQGQVQKRMNQLVRASTGFDGVVRFGAEGKTSYAELAEIDEQLTDPTETTVLARMFVIIYGDPAKNQGELQASLNKLDENCEEVINTIRNMPGANASRLEGADLRFLYLTAIAGEELAYPVNGLEHTEVGDSLSALALTETAFTGYRRWHSLYSTATGRFFKLNLFDTSITSSPVVLVLGGQGSGKSTLMADIVADVLSEVPHAAAYVTDFGSSFAWLCRIVGGRQYRFVDGEPRAINIFDYPGLEQGVMPTKTQVQLVVGFMLKLANVKADDDTAGKILKKAVLEVYRNEVPYNKPEWPRHEPTVSHLLEVLKTFPWKKGLQRDRADALYLSLEEYKGDPWLDAPTHEDYRAESPLHVFELDSLNLFEPDLKAALSYLVAALITRSTGKLMPDGTRTPTVHVYDEFWKIDAELPEMIYPVRKDTRQGRKEMVITMIGTHAYEDMEKLYGVVSNAGTRIIGLQNKGFDKLTADANLSTAACAAIRAIHNIEGAHAEYVISIGSGSKQVVEMFRVQYSPVKMWTYTSNAVERNARDLVDRTLGEFSDFEKIAWLAANWPRGIAFEGKTENDPEFRALLAAAQRWSMSQQAQAPVMN